MEIEHIPDLFNLILRKSHNFFNRDAEEIFDPFPVRVSNA